MEMTRERRVHLINPSLTRALPPAETRVPENCKAAKLHVPGPRIEMVLQPASGTFKLTAEENARFLRIISGCTQIATHYELFILMQGEMQFFLPQDILIATWGDFREKDPQFDVISGLPGVRTSRICESIVPLAKRLHKIWTDGGSQPIVLNKKVAELLACKNVACGNACAVQDMRLTLVHGICNRRDRSDSLYFALRRHPYATTETDARSRFLADFVIHQIDGAYRKVAALQTTGSPTRERPPSLLLSVREEEITYWVCQGKTNGQIAQILGISVNTVKNHVHRIFDKLGANNRTQAVVKYSNLGGRAESGSDGGIH